MVATSQVSNRTNLVAQIAHIFFSMPIRTKCSLLKLNQARPVDIIRDREKRLIEMGKKVTENPKKVIYYIEKRSICILLHFYTTIFWQKWAKKVKKGQKWQNNLFSRSLVIPTHMT